MSIANLNIFCRAQTKYNVPTTPRPLFTKVLSSFWLQTAFSGRHGITLWRPFPRPLIPKTRFLSQKSDELSANNAVCFSVGIPHKEDAHIGDVRDRFMPNNEDIT